MRVLLQKHLGSLRPVDEAGQEAVRGIKIGEIVACEIKRPRNVAHHRKFFALLQIVRDNTDQYATTEALLTAIKICLGHADAVELPSGRVVPMAKSISFASMSQDEFAKFYDQTVELVVKHFLPGVEEDALRQQVLEMIGEGTR